MTLIFWMDFSFLTGALILFAIPAGEYMARVFQGERVFLSPILRPVEKLFYRISGIDEREEMPWKTYMWAFLWFNFLGLLFLFLLELLQGHLPFNPQKLPGLRWDLALNTAISFTTNTNWQAYGGEQTMSYLTQMLGLAVHNFTSAAVGIAVLVAMIRGFIRKNADAIGNFWADTVRATIYVLLPLAVVGAILLMSQGVVQTLKPYVLAHTLEGKPQTIALGPAASQISIKQWGTNGGGFFNVNSAHPFENPTPASDFLETFAILFLPMALVFMYGAMLKNRRQGWAIFAAMFILYFVGMGLMAWTEMQGNPLLAKAGVAHGTNMEGKEVRFGVPLSVIWGETTTATANGSVNSMHDSFTPIPGMIEMFNIAIGEVIFGGVGVGLIGLLYYAIFTMFISGLMIGRTPELLGKKLEAYEIVMASIGILSPAVMILVLAGIAIMLPAGLSSLNNAGPHGLSEIMYAYCSALGNNGSAFAGLNANTSFYNLTLGLGMLIGRLTTIIPAIAIAGSLAGKKIVPTTVATFQTTSPLYVAMLVSVVFIVGALTFFPPFVLGPYLEQLLMHAGKVF